MNILAIIDLRKLSRIRNECSQLFISAFTNCPRTFYVGNTMNLVSLQIIFIVTDIIHEEARILIRVQS